MKYIVLHSAATYPSMTHVDRDTIDSWHRDRGFNGIGYHYVITRDGTLQKGRDEETTGAHVGGNNTGTLGICMAGGLKEGTQKPEDNYTAEQWTTLNKLLDDLMERYGNTPIVGHNFFPNYKSRGCPCFDWQTYAKWFNQCRNALHKPDDWYIMSKYDWHTHSPSDFEMPDNFYDEVDKK